MEPAWVLARELALRLVLHAYPRVDRGSKFLQRLTGWSRETVSRLLFALSPGPYMIGLAAAFGIVVSAVLWGFVDLVIRSSQAACIPCTLQGAERLAAVALVLARGLLASAFFVPFGLISCAAVGRAEYGILLSAGIFLTGYIEMVALLVRTGPDLPEEDRLFDLGLLGLPQARPSHD